MCNSFTNSIVITALFDRDKQSLPKGIYTQRLSIGHETVMSASSTIYLTPLVPGKVLSGKMLSGKLLSGKLLEA